MVGNKAPTRNCGGLPKEQGLHTKRSFLDAALRLRCSVHSGRHMQRTREPRPLTTTGKWIARWAHARARSLREMPVPSKPERGDLPGKLRFAGHGRAGILPDFRQRGSPKGDPGCPPLIRPGEQKIQRSGSTGTWRPILLPPHHRSGGPNRGPSSSAAPDGASSWAGRR